MTSTRRAALQGHAAMFLFALAISVSFTLGKRAVAYLAPETITAARFALACLVIGLLAIPLARACHFRAIWRYGVIGGLFAAYFVLMFEALALTDAVSVAAIFTLTPVMSTGFGRLLLGQRASAQMLAALALGALGAVWVVFRADIPAILAFDIGLGEMLFFIGCAAHAAYTPLTKRLSRGEPLPVFALGSLLGGLIVTLAWGGLRSGIEGWAPTAWASLPAIAWAAILYLGLVATALTFLLTRFAALRLPSGKVMAYGYLVPVFVILWEGILTGGWVSGAVWLGVGATVLALILLLAEHDQDHGQDHG